MALSAIAIVAFAASCGPSESSPSSSPAASQAASPSLDGSSSGPPAQHLDGTLDALIEAAQAEGSLTVIGLSNNRCGFPEIVDAFEQTYSLTIKELDPNASPADQVQAIKDTVEGGSDAPDIVDLSIAAAEEAARAELLAPYKVATWESITNGAKDSDGAWTGAYYGVLSFEVNARRIPSIPQTWADLLKPQYSGRVALAGDPRVSNQGSLAVYAAALANGGSLDDAAKGLDFFKQLATVGNLMPVVATDDTIDAGVTPLTIRWTYDSLRHRDASAGKPPIEVTVPRTGRLAAMNAQAIHVHAPHPNTARLWLEFLYSDIGQNLLLDGNCHPIRFDDLSTRGMIPVETLAKLPDTSGAIVPTVAQQTKATELIAADWDPVVGVDIR